MWLVLAGCTFVPVIVILGLTSPCQSCKLEAGLHWGTLLCTSELSTHVLHCCSCRHICYICRQVAFYRGSIKPFLALLLTLCKRLMAATGLLTVVGYTQQKHATLYLETWTTCWNVPQWSSSGIQLIASCGHCNSWQQPWQRHISEAEGKLKLLFIWWVRLLMSVDDLPIVVLM